MVLTEESWNTQISVIVAVTRRHVHNHLGKSDTLWSCTLYINFKFSLNDYFVISKFVITANVVTGERFGVCVPCNFSNFAII